MRAFSALLAFLIAALFAPAISAQVENRWVDPTLTWSLDLASSRWGQADAPIADAVLLAAPAEAPPDNEIRLCLASQQTQPAPDLDSDAIRSRGGQMDERAVRAAFPRAALRDIQISHQTIDGVSVAIVDGMSQSNRFRGRAFFTPTSGGSMLSTITCISTPGIAAALEAEVEAILASL